MQKIQNTNKRIINYSPTNILLSFKNSLNIDIFSFENLEPFKLKLKITKF